MGKVRKETSMRGKYFSFHTRRIDWTRSHKNRAINRRDSSIFSYIHHQWIHVYKYTKNNFYPSYSILLERLLAQLEELINLVLDTPCQFSTGCYDDTSSTGVCIMRSISRTDVICQDRRETVGQASNRHARYRHISFASFLATYSIIHDSRTCIFARFEYNTPPDNFYINIHIYGLIKVLIVLVFR